MRSRIVLALVALSTATSPTRAAEFVPGWAAETVWDSNVLRTSTNAPQDADYSLRTGPDVRFREKQGDLQYDVAYRPRYEAFLETNGINELDHFVEAEGRWQIDRASELQLTNAFAYTSSLSGVTEAVPVGVDAVAVVSPTRQRITINSGSLAFTHRMGPLWELSTRLFSQLYEYEEEFEPDSLANSGTIQLTRGVTPRLVAGFGAQVQRQDFDAVVENTEGSGTTFYQGFGVLAYNFSRTFRITGNVGPAWSVPDEPESEITALSYQVSQFDGVPAAVNPNTCGRRADGVPVFSPTQRNGGCQPAFYRVAGEPFAFIQPGNASAPRVTFTQVPFEGELSNGSLSYFGRLSVNKDWQLWKASLSFERTASTASGVGGSTVLTAFEGNLRWVPARDWTLDLNAIYTQQSAANDTREQLVALISDPNIVGDLLDVELLPGVPGGPVVDLIADPVGVPFEVTSGGKFDNAIDIVTYRVELVAERRIGRHLRLTGRASYWQQESKGDLREERKQEIMRVIFGVNWTFDPIPL